MNDRTMTVLAVQAGHAEWIRAYDGADMTKPRSGRRAHRLAPLPPPAPELTPAEAAALRVDRDLLLEGYVSMVHEWAALMLESLSEIEIRERLEEVLPIALPPAVLVDCRDELNRLRTRFRELGIKPTLFRAPARARRAA